MAVKRVAILGLGRSGHDIHVRSLRTFQDTYEIVAVVDAVAERRVRVSERLGCAGYSDYSELFERRDLDLVVNALPSHQHVPVSLAFLERGFNVLTDKPAARSAREIDALAAAASLHGAVFAVFQQSRFSPAFVKLKEIVDSGRLGRIVQVAIAYNGFSRRWDWQTLREMNGGNLLNTGPHPVDQALQFVGADVMPEVVCRMDRANSFGDAEDYVKILLSAPGRPTVDVEISSCCAYPPPTYQVQGTQGGLVGDTSSLRWKWFDAAQAPTHDVIRAPLQGPDGSPAYCSESLTWHEESWSLPADAADDLFHAMATGFYRALHDTLETGQPHPVTLAQVRQQMAVMEACFAQNPSFGPLEVV
jgi:scyllo-inositol 2-dehydrogenase (NADP+)